MSQVWAALSAAMELLKFWKWFQKQRRAAQEVKRSESATKQNQAIDDSKKATTDDEIFDSQSRIVSNKPK